MPGVTGSRLQGRWPGPQTGAMAGRNRPMTEVARNTSN